MPIEKQNRYGQQSLSPICRLIFGDVYQATQIGDQGTFKFRVTAVCRPEGELFKNLVAQADRLIDLNFKEEKKKNKKLEYPLQACADNEHFNKRPEYAGLWLIKASANQEYPCKIVGKDGLPDATPGLIYQGCYVRLSLNPFAFDQMSKGVSFGLQGIAFVKDGKKIGGGLDPVAQFAAAPPSQEELSWGMVNDGEDIPF